LLGSGDASTAFQSFALRQGPLTYVSAPTVSGAESTLGVRIDDVLWHETESFVGLEPNDRSYVTSLAEDGKATATFGDGRRGARLPTGVNNVVAQYRMGIGKGGNVKGGAITLLAAKPLGVKDVVNPLAATGGADAETRDGAKRNIPTATAALDRLVSVRDYEDFTRTFAGVGKAAAVRLPVGRRSLVHVTIAGADDIPISTDSDLYRNLLESLRRFGDPFQAVQLALRELVVVVLTANVRLHPDYLWSSVEPKIRADLHQVCGFEQRELAQSVAASEVIAVIQAVPGVVYVDLDAIDGLTEAEAVALLTGAQKQLGEKTSRPVPARPARLEDGIVLPAQLAYVTTELENTVVLKEIT
jgi:predicted phage baseplate assembly protein